MYPNTFLLSPLLFNLFSLGLSRLSLFFGLFSLCDAAAVDGTGGTFEVDLAHNDTYDTRVLGAYSLDIVKQHNMSRGLYLYFAFHAVSVVFRGSFFINADVAIAKIQPAVCDRAVVSGPRSNECAVGDGAALPTQ